MDYCVLCYNPPQATVKVITNTYTTSITIQAIVSAKNMTPWRASHELSRKIYFDVWYFKSPDRWIQQLLDV